MDGNTFKNSFSVHSVRPTPMESGTAGVEKRETWKGMMWVNGSEGSFDGWAEMGGREECGGEGREREGA